MSNIKANKLRCPRCRSALMERTHRKLFDKVLNVVTMGVFDIKRYKCYTCLRNGIITRLYAGY